MDEAAGRILGQVGPHVVLGLPLGLGKPVPLVNALYQRAERDPTLQLTILTALTLEKPHSKDPIERSFLGPFVERVYRDYPDPAYAAPLREDRLPSNVRVHEFFFRPGSLLDSPSAQRNYVSSNYTHAARDVAAQGCNVIAHMVARRDVGPDTRYSLSSNPDLTLDLVRRLKAAQRRFLLVGVVNDHLPYMLGEAEVRPDLFDILVRNPAYHHTLFSVPKLPLSTPDFFIGLHASALVRDGGTVQVGIGELGDAIVHALLLRHRQTPAYQALLKECGALAAQPDLIAAEGGVEAFATGLFGASEMLVDGFKDLHEAGILKRRVYDFWALQRLINEGDCDPEHLSPKLFEGLEALGVRVLRGHDFETLQRHGVFTPETRYQEGYIVAPSGQRVVANVADPRTRRVLAKECLGQRLRGGTLIHSSFFLGSADFYAWLRGLGEEERREINMAGVDKVNQLDHNPRLYQEQRIHARFVNSALKVTLGGEVVSDGLEDGRVLSGVGGQYNFVAMAHQLATGRAILLLRATREHAGRLESNIVARYGHCTIPRHLRDLVVTEYGVADLRSQTDSEVAKRLIGIADSRFQSRLLEDARRMGKIEPDYRIPGSHGRNFPERLEALRSAHAPLFPAFPLGTEFTPDEQLLVQALKAVRTEVARGRLHALRLAMGRRRSTAPAGPLLRRLGLERPRGPRARLARRLVIRELAKLGAIAP